MDRKPKPFVGSTCVSCGEEIAINQTVHLARTLDGQAVAWHTLCPAPVDLASVRRLSSDT